MVRFICVTCQSVKDDIHQRWTETGVSTCDACCNKTSIGAMTSIAIDSVIVDCSKPDWVKGLYS